MFFFTLKDRFKIEGVMPQRALLRLRRAGIVLYDVKKTAKNQILLSVDKKDSEKVFAIYPNICYNKDGRSAYTAQKIGAVGIGKYLEFLKKRLGLILCGLLFVIAVLFFDSFTFGITFVGTDVYAREAQIALEQGGIRTFAPYKSGGEDMICAQLLSLDDVEYCSVKKQGLWIRVEMRLSSFSKPTVEKGNMKAKHEGKLLSLTALRGTPLKKIGERVCLGETLVGDSFTTIGGEQVRVEPIARASIACVYEAEIAAESEQQAFAIAYLAIDLSQNDEIAKIEIERMGTKENLFHVKIEYIAIESVNL